MLKRIYTCDCFLDIIWIYCLEINDGFVAFQKRCLKEKRYLYYSRFLQKEDHLIFFRQSLSFVAKHLSTFKYNYLLRKNLFSSERLLVTMYLQQKMLKFLILILTMMTVLVCMFGVTVTTVVMIMTVNGNKLTVLSLLYVFPK